MSFLSVSSSLYAVITESLRGYAVTTLRRQSRSLRSHCVRGYYVVTTRSLRGHYEVTTRFHNQQEPGFPKTVPVLDSVKDRVLRSFASTDGKTKGVEG